MEKVRVGVLGAGRGETMMEYCTHVDNAVLVAVCDKDAYFLERVKGHIQSEQITYYEDFEEFLKHDMDAVVLANYANDHAAFAVRCLQAGKHVMSEVLPCETLAEAVKLAEAVEQSEQIYAYGENYCFMAAPRQMRRLYRQGVLGEFEYGEGEYIHNCESIWPEITQGNPEHWRNNMQATFYCTHSLGPLLHITGLRPVRVTGFELPFGPVNRRMGAKAGQAGLELVELENGAVVKSIHGGLCKNSIWYTVYGTKGRLESAREDAENGDVSCLYSNLDAYEGECASRVIKSNPKDELSEKAEAYGHSGSDFYTMWNFVEKIKGNPKAEIIDVYEALDMGLPGILAYRSVLRGGVPVEVPDFRHPAVREYYRYDNACTNPKKAGEQYVPSYSKGVPPIAPEVYERIAGLWREKKEKEEQEEN
ncbi:MAG: Gfo/Idh/MocA family oxidoreductase [Lachnospiraceae bacterium]|nr:Gfo/Idh/MocA family oxidoreductase [Lachnospiraceae bacterium]